MTSRSTFQLTIVYSKTTEWNGYVYEMALRLLGDYFTADGQHRVVMFHFSMEKDSGARYIVISRGHTVL